jgi:DNA-binding transcriptional ArsR family regulator
MDETSGNPYINPKTGALDYTGESVGRKSRFTGRTYTDKKTGKEVKAKNRESVPLLSVVDDAKKLSSGTPQEAIYADYSNHLKAMANQARKEMLSTGLMKTNPSAKKQYASEVKSLNTKLQQAELNAPRERHAWVIANNRANIKIRAAGDISDGDKRKIRSREIAKARAEVHSDGTARRIHITDKEWKAIQAGAVSDSTLVRILNNSDPDELRALATPRNVRQMTPAKINKIKVMRSSGYTISEIAEQLNISASTVSQYMK